VSAFDDLRDAYELAGNYLGCGDNSCVFVKPKGMATNGGCRCIEHARPGVHASLGRVFRMLGAYLDELDADPFDRPDPFRPVDAAKGGDR
jgi:hypothetical protein